MDNTVALRLAFDRDEQGRQAPRLAMDTGAGPAAVAELVQPAALTFLQGKDPYSSAAGAYDTVCAVEGGFDCEAVIGFGGQARHPCGTATASAARARWC